MARRPNRQGCIISSVAALYLVEGGGGGGLVVQAGGGLAQRPEPLHELEDLRDA